jgi:hypothetical protein
VLFAHVQQCDEMSFIYRGNGGVLPPPLRGRVRVGRSHGGGPRVDCRQQNAST